MSDRSFDNILYSLTGLVILACFCILYMNDFLLFHCFAELFSITVGISIFVIAWNSRRFIENQYVIFLGVAFFFISFLDMLHTITYHGMPFFQDHGKDLPTQLWIAARYMQAITLVIAPFTLSRRLNINIIFIVFLFVTFIITYLIFYDLFPVCYLEGSGLTAFKKVSEYLISVILLVSIIFLFRFKDKFDNYVFYLILFSIITTILAELLLTLYTGVYSFANFIGHFFKIISFLLLYRALIVTGLKKPYNLLFRELSKSREEYRSLFENMIDGFARHRIITNKNGHPDNYVFVEINNAFEELTGMKREEIIGKKVTEIIPGIKEDPADWIGKYGEVAINGKSRRFESYSQDLERWYSVAAYSTEKNTFAAVFQDITDRKQIEKTLERKVKERTKELEERNRELQDFSFIASHDLQEPLRKIRTFGDMVNEKLKSGTSDQVEDFVTRMRDSAERMQNLLNSLLAYSRVTTAKKPFDKTDLSTVLAEALSNLEIVIKEKEAVIEMDPLPAIDADPSQIVQVFQNLIGNALKFNKPGEAPHIRIYCEGVYDEICRIAVRDNGIGFDKKYISKIFMPFQRLHGKSEYPGTGMGLAICKKIIERHGGQITADSQPGNGAEFIFTLPVKHSDY